MGPSMGVFVFASPSSAVDCDSTPLLHTSRQHWGALALMWRCVIQDVGHHDKELFWSLWWRCGPFFPFIILSLRHICLSFLLRSSLCSFTLTLSATVTVVSVGFSLALFRRRQGPWRWDERPLVSFASSWTLASDWKRPPKFTGREKRGKWNLSTSTKQQLIFVKLLQTSLSSPCCSYSSCYAEWNWIVWRKTKGAWAMALTSICHLCPQNEKVTPLSLLQSHLAFVPCLKTVYKPLSL